MTYNYLKYLSKNIVYIAAFTLMWTIIFFYATGPSPIFKAYIGFSALFFLISYLHWRGRIVLTAVFFVAASNVILLLVDTGIRSQVMTGVGFLYLINLLFASAFILEEMRGWFLFTLLSTLSVFLTVNYTSISPRLLAEAHSSIPEYIALGLFGLTAITFVVRLMILLFESAKDYMESSVMRTDSDIFFANLDESICIIDKDQRIKRYNKAFVDLFQKYHAAPPSVGICFDELKIDEARKKAYNVFFSRAFAGEKFSVEFDFTLTRALYILEVSFCPIIGKHGNIDRIGIIYRDITARKKLEMDIVYSQSGLLEMIAHDLKSPLAMIKNVNALSDISDSQYNKFIDKTCGQTIASIDNILCFSRYLVNNDPAAYEEENIGKILADKVAELDPNSAMAGQQIFLEIQDKDLSVRLNRDAFGRAFGNLISNAIKFTEGSAPIHIAVMKGVDKEAIIKVSDQGIGIPEEMRETLFERFTKSGRNGLKGEQSYGLGLYISNVIIKLHGGTLSLDTEQTVGTTFVMRLPLAGRHSAVVSLAST